MLISLVPDHPLVSKLSMGNGGGFRQLKVWVRSMDLVEAIYQHAARFPPHEHYGLGAQMRRASVSIPSNIAEGYGRGSRRDYLRHVVIANGSLMELETQILLAGRIGYLSAGETTGALAIASEVGRMLAGLVSALRRKPPTP
jgi:four helix bundle protein